MYKLKSKQLETISHYKRMFRLEADNIQDLCSSEKDDVVYGFELGKIYSHLEKCFFEMGDLEDEIKNQEI